MKQLTYSLVLGLLLSNTLFSQRDFGQMYQQVDIQYWQGRYQRSNQKMYNVLYSFLSNTEKASFTATRIVVNKTDAADPFAFYTDGVNIFTSAQSMMFLYDLCLSYAWLTQKSCELSVITDYVAMLRYQSRSNFVGNRYPTPLEAFGIPVSVEQDQTIQELALSLFNSTRAAIIAHEMGHIFHQHPGNRAVSTLQSRIHEIEADESSLELLSRIPKAPVGLMLYFQLLSHSDWNSWSAGNATHPLNSDRIRRIANFLRVHASDFAKDPVTRRLKANGINEVKQLAQQFEDVAILLDDEDIQTGIQLAAENASVRSFRTCTANNHRATINSFTGNFRGNYIRNLTNGYQESLPVSMFLQKNGNIVTGSFNFGFGNALITNGYVQSNKLYFLWQWGQNYGKGQLFWINGQLIGTWGYRENDTLGGEWRLQPG